MVIILIGESVPIMATRNRTQNFFKSEHRAYIVDTDEWQLDILPN